MGDPEKEATPPRPHGSICWVHRQRFHGKGEQGGGEAALIPRPGSAPGCGRRSPGPPLPSSHRPHRGPAACGSHLRFAQLQLLLSLLVLHGLCGEGWGQAERGRGRRERSVQAEGAPPAPAPGARPAALPAAEWNGSALRGWRPSGARAAPSPPPPSSSPRKHTAGRGEERRSAQPPRARRPAGAPAAPPSPRPRPRSAPGGAHRPARNPARNRPPPARGEPPSRTIGPGAGPAAELGEGVCPGARGPHPASQGLWSL